MDTTTINTELTLTGAVQPGVINYNVDAFKEQALQIKRIYENMTYSAASAKDVKNEMKDDRAKLNKAIDKAKAKLSEVKNAYMTSFTEFDSEIKAAVNTITEAKDFLDKKIKEFEAAERAEKKAQITDYYDASFDATGIDPNVKSVIFTIIYDPRWENTSTSPKTYKDGIDNALCKYEDGVKALSSDSYKDYHDEAMKVFMQSLDLSKAIAEVEMLKKRDEEVLRRNQERIEAEARKKAEAELLEAKKKMEEAEKAAMEAQKRAELAEMKNTTTVSSKPSVSATESVPIKPTGIKLSIHVIGGAIVGVYSDSDAKFDVSILDEDFADTKEIADFAKSTIGLKQIY